MAGNREVGESASLRSATVWSYSLTWGKQAITGVLSFVLAAMLGPEAFGVVAMALVFTSFIQMLQQQGLMPAIISRRELTDLQKDTAFWMVVGAGSVLTLVGIALAPLWAAVNQLPELTGVIWVLALTIPLSSSIVVHEAILRRSLEFKRLAFRSWSSVVAGGLAGIGAAFLGWGVWALVAQQVVMSVIDVVVLWGVSSWRPRLRWSPIAARDLWSYSARSASSSLGLFLGGRMDVMLGGVYFGPSVIGLYRMGQRVTEMAMDVTARGMQAVSLPGLAAVQHDHDAFTGRFRAMLRQASSFSLPLLGMVAGLAPCVERLLGSEWRGVATAVSLLAVVQAIRSVSLLMGPALQAAGRPGALSLVLWFFAALNVLALVAASHVLGDGDSLVALCIAMIAATTIGSAAMAVTVSRCLHIRMRVLLSACIPGIAAGVAAAGVTYTVYQAAEHLPWVIAGGIAGLLGLIVAGLIVVSLDESMKSRLPRPLGRRRHRVLGEPVDDAARVRDPLRTDTRET